MNTKTTTFIDSTTAQKLIKGIPGMKLIAWADNNDPESPLIALYYELDIESDYCLFLEMELREGCPPFGNGWGLMKRKDIADFFWEDNPEYNGRNYIVSQDPYWKQHILASTQV